MRRIIVNALAIALLFALIPSARAGQRLVSTMGNVSAVSAAAGYYLRPVSGVSQTFIAGDEAPAQLFEIVRPNNERISIGRLHTSCSCVQLEASKSTFEAGEPALLTLRNVRPTPPNGQGYALYVQIVSPVRATLRQDTFVQSDRFRSPAPTTVRHSYEYAAPAVGPMNRINYQEQSWYRY